MDFASEEAKGLPFVPSFALGVLIAAPVLTGVLIACRQAPLRLYARVAGIWGTLAGVFWNAGNVSLSRVAGSLMCSCLPLRLFSPSAEDDSIEVLLASTGV